jgi:hypothetical protein
MVFTFLKCCLQVFTNPDIVNYDIRMGLRLSPFCPVPSRFPDEYLIFLAGHVQHQNSRLSKCSQLPTQTQQRQRVIMNPSMSRMLGMHGEEVSNTELVSFLQPLQSYRVHTSILLHSTCLNNCSILRLSMTSRGAAGDRPVRQLQP